MEATELIQVMDQIEKKGLEWKAVEEKVKVSEALLRLYAKSGPVPVTIMKALKKVLEEAAN
ncbi:MAG: hypothetical protein COZ11_10015 [Deltaproteobacteria bacterium CG_4_10_14_3_um_filter_51_14]|nr:hypothetical protein [bacterium]NCP10300.1 hypothetical protein [bacterium]OIP40476.1 MAG: hypothetical protein AUK25_07595 [Desulfobacteraceae bacterium CG2_30_51_40]PIY23280.1 MAG: hypothetical protein COZ11_10015 [Deltaproteobacteria bacterium CG_4_10_14_3_um_filter_51_14]PJB39495.1 MAG: hypothetical protein CO107_00100 [Deltaproteobacteria bacterium CG_4_9_14_3_um_filter_51_14]